MNDMQISQTSGRWCVSNIRKAPGLRDKHITAREPELLERTACLSADHTRGLVLLLKRISSLASERRTYKVKLVVHTGFPRS